MPKFTRKTIIILTVLLIVALLIVAAVTAMERDEITVIESALRDFFAPLKRGAVLLYAKMAAIPQYFSDFNELKAENEALKEEIVQLNSELNRMEEASIENAYLRDMLSLSQDITEWLPVASNVIGRSSATWYNTVTIKGGENQGFLKDMPVITSDGLVGRIMTVSRYTSEVILITDMECAVGAMVQINKTPGVTEGNGMDEGLSMIHIPYGAQITADQVVITSGLGGIFPKGLRIGYITAVTPDRGDLMIKAEITPFVDFERLDNVLVLTRIPESALVPAITGGTGVGEAADEAGQDGGN